MPTKEIAPGVLAVTELPKDVSPYIPRWGKTKRLSYKYWSGGMKTGMFRVYHIKLPPGQWSIVGWSDELTEDVYRSILEDCCPVCGSSGFDIELVLDCCGYTTEHGSCCNNPIQRQIQIPCRACDSTGHIDLLRSHGIDRALIIKKEK